ncbi:MAG TPA: hypothetical protein PK668_20970 [Myxococcota bacterium]|nr:hypothetical protein [Myxococcota bacterium]HRY96615.1 hypothetical protein [Myxococcota bacterium]HSA21410.1 hypothetical protein [Myxococcota bacterium]
MNTSPNKPSPALPRPPARLAHLPGGAALYALRVEAELHLWLMDGDGPPLAAPALRLPTGEEVHPARRRAGWLFELGAARPASIWLTYVEDGWTRGELIELA